MSHKLIAVLPFALLAACGGSQVTATPTSPVAATAPSAASETPAAEAPPAPAAAPTTPTDTPTTEAVTMSEIAPKILLETSEGNITLELDAVKAPKTVANFVAYVKAGHYDGLIFHRVIKDFMVQGGGYGKDGRSEKPTNAPIQNEGGNGLPNVRGSIAMARTNDPHSATAQFFINHRDNAFLNAGERGQWGYAVFGKVTEGMDVVDKIAVTPTGAQDVPKSPITIIKATIVG